MWPLAVATRFLVEATASRNQPRPQTLLPRLWARVSSTSRVMAPHELEAGEDQDADAVGQARGRPGGALEEVVGGVQAVALGVIAERGRGGRSRRRGGGVCLPRHMTQARSSWQQVTAEGWVKVGARASTMGAREGIMVHMGGTSHSLGTRITLKDRRNPLPYHPARTRATTGHLFKSLRKSS